MGPDNTESGKSEKKGRFLTNEYLRYVGAGLAYTIAIIHLFHPSLGLTAFLAYIAAGTPLIDPRPAAFVLSGIAIMIGVNLIVLGVSRLPIYFLGITLMIIYITGYFAWHMFGHGAWWPLGPEHLPVSHTFTEILFGPHHLRNDRLALSSKLAELALLVILAVLYSRES